MKEPAGEEKGPDAMGGDPERVEAEHHGLHREPEEQHPASTEAIGEHADERTRDHAHRAVGREDHPDERKRQAKSQARDGQDRKRNAARDSGEEVPGASASASDLGDGSAPVGALAWTEGGLVTSEKTLRGSSLSSFETALPRRAKLRP